MNSNEIQNDQLKSVLMTVETLQKEYEVTLQQYQEAGKNYITALQNTLSNPCYNYNSDSTGVSQACYEKIWADQGCTTTGVVNASTDWAKSQTLSGLVQDSYLWATLTDETHRKGCYGDSTDYTTNTSPINPKTPMYESLKGRTWWGVSGIKEGPAESEKECSDMCLSSDNCSGATFNTVQRYCWTRTGDSKITNGRGDDVALIPKQKAALAVMKKLNETLLTLNDKISEALINIKPEVMEQLTEKNEKQRQLNESYQRLLEQKVEMDRQLQEYDSINQEEENQGLYVTQQNVSFRFWVLVTCLIVLVTLKNMFGSANPPISTTLWLLIIIVLIILTYSLSSPAGFLMWFVLLISIVLMKSGNFPSP